MTSGCPRRRRPWSCRLSTKDWDASLSIIQTDYSIHNSAFFTCRDSKVAKLPNATHGEKIENASPLTLTSHLPRGLYRSCRYVNNFSKLDHVINGIFSVSLIFHSKANFAYKHLVCPSIVCTCLSLFEMSYGPIVTRKTELSKTNPNQLGLIQPLTQS